MIIEKEYEKTVEDYLSFQEYYYEKNNTILNVESFVSLFLSIFILISLQYISDNFIIVVGKIISLGNVIRIILEIFFKHKIIKSYLRKNYYKDFKKNYVKVKIDENNLSESDDYSETKVDKSWIKRFINTKDYFYLADDKNFTLIIPKKYYTLEEQDFIIRNFSISET